MEPEPEPEHDPTISSWPSPRGSEARRKPSRRGGWLAYGHLIVGSGRGARSAPATGAGRRAGCSAHQPSGPAAQRRTNGAVARRRSRRLRPRRWRTGGLPRRRNSRDASRSPREPGRHLCAGGYDPDRSILHKCGPGTPEAAPEVRVPSGRRGRVAARAARQQQKPASISAPGPGHRESRTDSLRRMIPAWSSSH
jgi:hypothetical protein